MHIPTHYAVMGHVCLASCREITMKLTTTRETHENFEPRKGRHLAAHTKTTQPRHHFYYHQDDWGTRNLQREARGEHVRHRTTNKKAFDLA
jgi:hypothetical protein